MKSKAREFLKQMSRTNNSCPNCNYPYYTSDSENPGIIFVCAACGTHFEDDEPNVILSDALEALKIQEDEILADIVEKGFFKIGTTTYALDEREYPHDEHCTGTMCWWEQRTKREKENKMGK